MKRLRTPLRTAALLAFTAICLPGTAQQGDAVVASARVSSTVTLQFEPLNGVPFAELSGLAWDADEHLLYAVSDAGHLYHLELAVAGDEITAVKLRHAAYLEDENGNALEGDMRDAEGLDLRNADNGIRGDSELLVAFERFPRIVSYDSGGGYRGHLQLRPDLRQRQAYARPNKALETVAVHPVLGILAGAELPLKNAQQNQHKVFHAEGASEWAFPPAPYANSSFTGMAAMVDGSLLLLERAFTSLLKPVYISLRQLSPDGCGDGERCRVRELLVMSSQLHGYVDNYEGLARLDHNRFLLVSDDNNSPLQRTLLSLVVLH